MFLAKNGKFWSRFDRKYGMWVPDADEIRHGAELIFGLHMPVKVKKRSTFGQNQQISKINVVEISACGCPVWLKSFFGIKLVILCSRKKFYGASTIFFDFDPNW